MPDEWQWDETLYAGSAAFYPVGRMPYPAEVADALTAELDLDGSGRLLDAGCGPGSLTLLLAPLFEHVVAIDADRGMIAQARAEAQRAGRGAISWLQMRAEELPAGLGLFRLVTFAQSFHWMDRLRVASAVRQMIEPGGACVLIHATTHEGVACTDGLPSPRPPREAIARLVARYLGPDRRAGQGTLPSGPPYGEDIVMRNAGFTRSALVETGGGTVAERTEDEVVASIFSLSSAAPHLFGDRLPEFERDLRNLLRAVSPYGHFSERTYAVALDVWRP